MKAFLIKTAVNAVALWVAVRLIDGLIVTGPGREWYSEALLYLVVALILTAVNAIVKPVVKLLSLPLYLLSLGLFAFVVNALMLELTAKLSEATPVTFAIDDFFWSAVLGALVITVATMAMNLVLPDGK